MLDRFHMLENFLDKGGGYLLLGTVLGRFQDIRNQTIVGQGFRGSYLYECNNLSNVAWNIVLIDDEVRKIGDVLVSL